MDTFINWEAIVIGFCFVVFNKEIANSAIDFYYKTIRKRYRINQFRFPMYFAGSIILIGGILGLFHIIF